MFRSICTFIAPIALVSVLTGSDAFSPMLPQFSVSKYVLKTQLCLGIESDQAEEELVIDDSIVSLTLNTASVMSGTVEGGVPVPNNFKRFNEISPLSNPEGVAILCKGEGTENYVDPGESTERIVTLAPLEAASQALGTVEAAPSNVKKTFVNVAGGDDLMVHEVLDAVKLLTSELEGSSFEFRSLCHDSFPLMKCGIAVVAATDDSNGEVYWNGGKWWTLLEKDLNTES